MRLLLALSFFHIAVFVFVAETTAQPKTALQAAIDCKGTPIQLLRCLEREQDRAADDLAVKTRAFVSTAEGPCTPGIYAEWQKSARELLGIRSVAEISTFAGGASTAGLLARIDHEMLESRFMVADAALRNAGPHCRKFADAEYRQIVLDYRDPAYGYARDRAKVGIDDVRALPPARE